MTRSCPGHPKQPAQFRQTQSRSFRQKLESMTESLETEWAAGKLTKEEYKLISERLKDLSRLQQKIQTLSPVAENFL
jgi:hypothetical protein